MLNEKLVENIFKYFMFFIWLALVPVFMFLLAPMLTIMNLSIFLPTDILNILSSEIGHYFITSIFLALMLLPWSWSEMKIDFMGNPRYEGFSKKKFFITIFATPIIFGYILAYFEYGYYEVFAIYVEWSQKAINNINSVFNSELLKIILPLLPIAFMSFILFKYFIYLFIIGTIHYVIFVLNFLMSY